MELHRLQIIYKTVERCNLACPYCYYFYGADQTYRDRPARTTLGTLDALCDFLAKGLEDIEIGAIDVIFHGGEPMLQKLDEFAESCRRLRERLDPLCNLHLAIQTNGTKLNEQWTAVLMQYDVALGVSIDGPPQIHDPNRPFHNGRGSFDEIGKRLGMLRAQEPTYYSRGVGTLTVLDAAHDYREIVRFFSDDLGIQTQSFLLPDCNHNDGIPAGRAAEEYGKALCDIFDQWLETPDLSVREVDKILRRFQRARLSEAGHERMQAQLGKGVKFIGNHVIVLQSDGALKVDDSYIPAEEWRAQAPTANVRDTSLLNYLTQDFFEELHDAIRTPPTECSSCMWVNICGGGDLENRWSSERRFDNPSVFCSALKQFYEHVVGYLVANGYPIDDVYRRLSGDYRPTEMGYAS